MRCSRLISNPNPERALPWNGTTLKLNGWSDDHRQSDLTDANRTIIESMLPKRERMGRPCEVSLRSMFDAIRHILSTGCQWCELPSGYPPFRAVQHHFHQWRRRKILEHAPHRLRAPARQRSGRSSVPLIASVDSQSVRTEKGGDPRGYGARKRVKGRKRHLAVDADDTPIVMTVHPADVLDRNGAPDVITRLPQTAPAMCRLFADDGFAGPKLSRQPGGKGLGNATGIIEKPKDVSGFTVPYLRWIVKWSFAWMGRRRRLSKDYWLLSGNSLSSRVRHRASLVRA